jgi:hypothetical protein
LLKNKENAVAAYLCFPGLLGSGANLQFLILPNASNTLKTKSMEKLKIITTDVQ